MIGHLLRIHFGRLVRWFYFFYHFIDWVTDIIVLLLLDYELIEESLIAASALNRDESFFLVILLTFNHSFHGISISINGIALNYTAKKMPQYF